MDSDKPMDSDRTVASDKDKENKSNWAPPTDHLEVGAKPKGVNTARVQGRKLTGPQQGFGKMWQKTYKVAIPNRTPQEVVAAWKADYGRFWPKGSNFHAPLAGIKPGEVGLISSAQGPLTLSTGVLVLYSDDVSFSYMTPEGHPFAGFITFSAHEEDPVGTMAQVQLLLRANDPIYEVGMIAFGSRNENKMWQHTLRSLADYLGSSAPVSSKIVCVDKKRLWKNFSNVRYNGTLPWAKR